MKLKFDPQLDYQRQAIEAVVNVFDGQPIERSDFEISLITGDSLVLSDIGIGNQVVLDDRKIFANVQKIQLENNIEKTTALQGREFSIEMETGTGKTYVYLRTIFELSKRYGLKKFIIVVPSVAIREGVLKSIDIMKEHFKTIYDNEPFDYFVYDSKKLGRVRHFSSSNQIQIMVINIQSFQKDLPDKNMSEMTEEELKKLNVINRENDRMSGRKPIEFIQTANPIVIIDEPQSVDSTPTAKRAIANLNPLATLRYSATHRDTYNLLYKLDPVRAYDLRLVKRIEVASVRSENSFNDAYVKLLKTDNRKGIKAQMEIHRQKSRRVKIAKVTVRQGDDLFLKSGERENYRDGYMVKNIDCTPGGQYVEFDSGRFLEVGQEIGGLQDNVMKAQVYTTIEQHLNKELMLKEKGIKVLSLFFIDRVANYRIYENDGTTSLGKIGQWFEDSYKDITSKPRYKEFATSDISEIHNGYFSKDRRGQAKDTTGKTKDDEDTYNLIMKDKERLLDPKEPLRFIFSHSALREGWDNPNVFQICTLNESVSTERKRQEIGRGLRLPVNKNGERVHDENINRLTIIANESYEDFAQSLQNEFEEDCGIKFGRIEKTAFAEIPRIQEDGQEKATGQHESIEIWHQLHGFEYIDQQGYILDRFKPEDRYFELRIGDEYDDIKAEIIDVMKRYIFENRIVDARKQCELKLNKHVRLSPEFESLWDKIKHRTRYRVNFETEDLVDRAAERIRNIKPIKPVRITVTKVGIDISGAGVEADRKLAEDKTPTKAVKILPDLLAYLQKETELTRGTLAQILADSGRLSDFRVNPQQFMTLAAREISRAANDLILKGIEYEKMANQYWEMRLIEEEAETGIVRYLDNLYEVQNQDKSLFNAIEFDSEVEKRFAKDLDNNEDVRLFVKLPKWFNIDTPVGSYNPDWAFVTERDERLYFVRETKSSEDDEELRKKESQKIFCAKSHFETIGVNYDIVTTLADVDF